MPPDATTDRLARSTEPLNWVDVQALMSRAGRDDAPRVLDWAVRTRLAPSLWGYGGLVAEVWSNAEMPTAVLPTYRWRTLFERAGYSDCGECAVRPDRPWVHLYRGVADHRRRLGMSWTTDLDQACWFERYHSADGLGLVYESHVPPWRFLAHIGGEQCNESQYVVRTDRRMKLRRL